MQHPQHILFLVSNDIATDHRVLRHATSLKNAGFKITVVGRKHANSLPIGSNWNGIDVKRFSLWFNKGPLFYLNLNARLFFYGLFHPANVVCANDTDTLLAASWIKKLRQKTLVFDAHEYFTEVPELVHRPKVQKLWKRIEDWGIPKADLAYSVCQPIANRYAKNHNIPFYVIRNIAFKIKSETDLHLPALPKTFIIYQGVLNVGRGIELMIDAIALLPHLHLVICGKGDIEDELKQKALQIEANNVHFLGNISPEILGEITPKAQLGLSLEEDLGYNYRNALPNKIFSYIQAKVPVICANLPEMKQLVLQHKVGVVLEERTPKQLAKLMEQTLANREKYTDALQQSATSLVWEQEAKKLVNLFKNL